MKKVTVVGLGYVGLPTAISAAQSGYKVFGIDIDHNKINNLEMGISYLENISHSTIKDVLAKNTLEVANKISASKSSEIYLICVPTPLSMNRKPDLSFLQNATMEVGKNLKHGDLVIVESTVEPGTIRNTVLPLLEKYSKLDQENFYLAFSPERIDPGNESWQLENVPKLVSGIDNKSLEKTLDFYRKFINNLVVVASLEIAETAKLLENSFRLLNISFINELSIYCNKIGIEINDVISAASTKPYGFMPFYPSVGVGGHCIPVDPIYLVNAATKVGINLKMLGIADEINRSLPEYFIGRAYERIGNLKDKKILVLGVSYKPNISDIRESAVEGLITALKREGAKVFWHDDLVKVWNGERSTPLGSGFDLAIIATPHSYLDLKKLGKTPILNSRKSI